MTEAEFFTTVEELLPNERSIRLTISTVKRRPMTKDGYTESERMIKFSFVKVGYNTEEFSAPSFQGVLQQVKNYAL